MKKFEFKNQEISIERTGYGQYILRGLGTSVYTTDSSIYDWCDDDSDESKYMEAQERAYQLLINSIY